MLRMYRAQRQRGGFNPYGVGTINLGDVLYLQDGVRAFGVSRGWSPVRREPWIVVAFLNREYSTCDPRRPFSYMRGGDLIEVRSLRDGRVKRIGSWLPLWCIEVDEECGLGLVKEYGVPLPIPTGEYKPIAVRPARPKRTRRELVAA